MNCKPLDISQIFITSLCFILEKFDLSIVLVFKHKHKIITSLKIISYQFLINHEKVSIYFDSVIEER